MTTCFDKIKDFNKNLKRKSISTLQINVGYKCNLTCEHCHFQAGPERTEEMSWAVMQDILKFVRENSISNIDITGGAPELNPFIKDFIKQLKLINSVKNINLRTNLVILNSPEYSELAEFFAENKIELTASLPCYLEKNVDKQRGHEVFKSSVKAIKKLNLLGYGQKNASLKLNLVYNPGSAKLPPDQQELEKAYKQYLESEYDMVFNKLYTITNLPIGRFKDDLTQKNSINAYKTLLKSNFNPCNLDNLMCLYQLSVDWQGRIYDCDFNQALGLIIGIAKPCIDKVKLADVQDLPVIFYEHCYACCAGSGSSCVGSLTYR